MKQAQTIDPTELYWLILRQETAQRAQETAQRIERRIDKALRRTKVVSPPTPNPKSRPR